MDYPLQQIVAELKTLCSARRTGVFRVTTDQNHSAQVGLEAGRIVAMRYRIKRGLDALELLKQVVAGQYSFEEDKSIGNEEASLPTNAQMFAQLEGAAATAPKVAPKSVPATPASGEATSAASFSTTAKAALQDTLTEYIGPMAGIVCRNVLNQAASLGEAVEMLKQKIPDATRAEQFERDVMKRTLA